MTMKRLLPLLGLGFRLASPMPAQAPMTAIDSARHVLNRLAYGAAPDEIEAIARDGVIKWVDRQLGFSDIRDPGLAAIENTYEVFKVSRAEMSDMLQKNQGKVQRAQAITDSATRQRIIDELRMEQQGNRRSLQALIGELQAVTLVRAVRSDRQLDEILADFWTNHFNVYLNKNQDRAYFADYLETTIRGHALGKFEDILVATAKSPAMLFYLDNAQSVADGSDARPAAGRGGRAGRAGFPVRRPGVFPPNGIDPMSPAGQQAARQRAPHGLNENYARELMELHTLGVDGGYTQQDVIAVARILTGWTIDRANASYVFRDPVHDDLQKVVLGQKFDAGHGEDEGMRLLKMLASEPATMHHVSAQLCARFVNDAPPDGCIDDAVRAWKKSNGEIREVVRAILHSPDFWAPVNVMSKVKTPLEFVVSALRAVHGIPDSTPRLSQRVAQLGEPLFQHTTPDGYGERQQDWVNSGALLARMNFAVQLASGSMPGTVVDLDNVVAATDDHTALVAAVDKVVLGGAMTEQTRKTILKELADMTDPRMARALAVGLAIGGPEFQRQ